MAGRKIFLIKLALALGSVTVSLLIFEGVLRCSGYRMQEPWISWAAWDIPESHYRLDSQRIWAHRPFWRNPWGEFETDALGLRLNHKSRIRAAPKDYRIVLVGDSFTYGYGLPGNQTVAVYLQWLLRNAGYDVRVLNAGVAGYGPSQEYIFLKDVILPRIQPDLVVWNFDYSDSGDMEIRALHLLVGGRLIRVPGWTHGIYLAGALQRKFSEVFPDSRTVNFILNVLPDFDPLHYFYRNNEGLILQAVQAMVAQIQSDTGGRLVATETPSLAMLTEGGESVVYEERVRVFFSGVRDVARWFLPTNNSILGRANGGQALEVNDLFFDSRTDIHRHLTPYGNKIYAKMMADFFESTGIARRFPSIR